MENKNNLLPSFTYLIISILLLFASVVLSIKGSLKIFMLIVSLFFLLWGSSEFFSKHQRVNKMEKKE